MFHRMMFAWSFLAWFAFSPLASTPLRAAVLDQSYVPPSAPLQWGDIGENGSGGKAEQAQTFRVGIDGRLIGADLYLTGYGENLLLEVRRVTADGLPSESSADLLGAAIASPGSLGGVRFVSFDFGPKGPMVAAGETLALVVQSLGRGLYDWGGNSGDPYPHGGIVARSSVYNDDRWFIPSYPASVSDYGFRTYVEPVPEPSTVLIFAVGGLGAWCIKQRRSNQVPL